MIPKQGEFVMTRPAPNAPVAVLLAIYPAFGPNNAFKETIGHKNKRSRDKHAAELKYHVAKGCSIGNFEGNVPEIRQKPVSMAFCFSGHC